MMEEEKRLWLLFCLFSLEPYRLIRSEQFLELNTNNICYFFCFLKHKLKLFVRRTSLASVINMQFLLCVVKRSGDLLIFPWSTAKFSLQTRKDYGTCTRLGEESQHFILRWRVSVLSSLSVCFDFFFKQ